VAEHNLPEPLTSLVGRAREAAAIDAALRRNRLVTVAGPGGVGKTRLALQVARDQVPRHADGVWLVDLAAEAPDVTAETARSLGVGGPRALRPFLAERELLVVLDNCEHVVDACARLAADLLATCRNLRILATSRESLGVTGETVWRLEPLAAADAQRLFVERARQRRPQFVPDESVEPLCERLDRMPLAIELAAARVSAMSPAEILAGLRSRLDVLGAGERLAPPQHRTLRAAVAWSDQLLDPREQRAFRDLAVFAGGFDAAAATAVARGLTLDALARLVDKSLVAAAASPRGTTRYRLLETVREYAQALLAETGELEAARARHLAHFSALGDIAREEWLATGAQRFANELDEDYDNVRTALEWAIDADPPGALRLLAGTRDLFFRFGQADGFRLAQRALERCRDRGADRVHVLIAAGQFAVASGDLDAATEPLARARELSAELGEPVLEAWARFFQGLAKPWQAPGSRRASTSRRAGRCTASSAAGSASRAPRRCSGQPG